MAQFRTTEEKFGNAGRLRFLRERVGQSERIPDGSERLLERGAVLFEALAESRLQLLCRDVPKASISGWVGKIYISREGVARLDHFSKRGATHAAIDYVADALLRLHRFTKLVDQNAVRLEKKSNAGFLTFQRELLFRETVKRVPRRRAGEQFGCFACEGLKINIEGANGGGLARIDGAPTKNALTHIGEGAHEGGGVSVLGAGLGAHPRQGGLAREEPIVRQERMANEEGRHAEAGGVADAERSAQMRRKAGGAGRIAPTGDMVGKIKREGPDEPNSEHLRLERAGEFRAVSDLVAIGNAEFAVAIDRGRAQ